MGFSFRAKRLSSKTCALPEEPSYNPGIYVERLWRLLEVLKQALCDWKQDTLTANLVICFLFISSVPTLKRKMAYFDIKYYRNESSSCHECYIGKKRITKA